MARLTHTELVAQITTMIESVADSGEVMSLWGQTPTWVTRDREAGQAWWNIRRASASEVWPSERPQGAVNDYKGAETEETTVYSIEMKYPWSLDEAGDGADASEPKFEALVDGVRDRFRSGIDMDGLVEESGLLQYDSGQTGFVVVRAGDDAVLCHLAQFTLTIRQFVSRP